MCPYTSYEIRRELRVRECRQTAMVFDKKYFNCDTGKCDTNKIETIPSYSLGYIGFSGAYMVNGYKTDSEDKSWFVPRDNDFE